MVHCLVQIHNSSYIHMTSYLYRPLSSSMKLSSCTAHSSLQYKESVRSALIHPHLRNDFVNLLLVDDNNRIVLSFSTMPIHSDDS